MTITLLVLAWLLCGFIGNYIGWRFIDKRAYDMEFGLVGITSLLGVITLLASLGGCLYMYVQFSKIFSYVVFKRKKK